jgi:lysophospholipase L1-like esterase
MILLYTTEVLLILSQAFAHDPAGLLSKINEGASLTVACVGDSITNGKYLGESSYPQILQKKLGSMRFKVSNFGLDGTCIVKTCSKPYWQTKEYSAAKSSQPNIVIIQFGTNDPKFGLYNKRLAWNSTDSYSANIFRRDYIDMIERFQSLKSHPTVFLCIPPPVYCRRCWFDINAKVINEELPAIIADIAYRTGAVLVNNFEPLGGIALTKPLMFYKSADPREWPEKMPEDGKFGRAFVSFLFCSLCDTKCLLLLEFSAPLYVRF